MKADLSRWTFDSGKDYTLVIEQQGRVALDADANERAEIEAYLRETSLADAIGPCGAPRREAGFRIEVAAGGELVVGPGRMYVAGTLCQLRPGLEVEAKLLPLPQTPLVWGSTVDQAVDDALQTARLAATGQMNHFFVELEANDYARLGAAPPGVVRALWRDGAAASSLHRVLVADVATRRLTLYGQPPAGVAMLLRLRGETTFRWQPQRPGASDQPTAQGAYLAYLDVWQRHVTSLVDPEIREPALGGPDTCTRAQTVVQVKLLELGPEEVVTPVFEVATLETDALEQARVIAPGDPSLATVPWSCASAPARWRDLIAPSSGRLRARALPSALPTDPCIVPAAAGYRGLENQLYRVEIHDGGDRGHASFKWSRENGSVVMPVRGQNGGEVTLASTGPDAALGIRDGDWVELIDTPSELEGTPGAMAQVKVVDPELPVVTLHPPPAGADPADTPLLRRWESGAIPLSTIPAGGWFPLEDGIEVWFGEGTYRTGDYWCIPARAGVGTEAGALLWPLDPSSGAGEPLARQPDGVAHHYCKLALLRLDAGVGWHVVSDCRPLFPALTEQTLFSIAGGDGQQAMPGEALPCELAVGVANGQAPVVGSRVRFKTSSGRLAAGGTPAVLVVVTTDAKGIARCRWTLPAAVGAADCLTVEAALLDPAGNPLEPPLSFHAGASVAAGVAYTAESCPHLAGVQTVAAALDKLCPTFDLSYVGGDGQIGDAGAVLARPLQVRVSILGSPEPGAVVDFQIRIGHGKLTSQRLVQGTGIGTPTPITSTTTPDTTIPTATTPVTNGVAEASILRAVPPIFEPPGTSVLRATTNAHGVASCYWTLPPAQPPADLSVTAMLAEGGFQSGPPSVTFGAVAVVVAAPPAVAVIEVKRVTVEDEETANAFSTVSNDGPLSVQGLIRGLDIHCSASVAPESVGRVGAPATRFEQAASRPTCVVTLDLPWTVVVPATGGRATGGPVVVGYQPVVVQANVTVDENHILWVPSYEAGRWLDRLVDELVPVTDQLLARLTVETHRLARAPKSGPDDALETDTQGPPAQERTAPLPSLPSPGVSGSPSGQPFQLWFWVKLEKPGGGGGDPNVIDESQTAATRIVRARAPKRAGKQRR